MSRSLKVHLFGSDSLVYHHAKCGTTLRYGGKSVAHRITTIRRRVTCGNCKRIRVK